MHSLCVTAQLLGDNIFQHIRYSLIKSAPKNWAIAKQLLNAHEPACEDMFTLQISGATTAKMDWLCCNAKYCRKKKVYQVKFIGK